MENNAKIAKVKTARNICFTSFEDKEPQFNIKYMMYMVFQREQCPTTKKLHYQGYVEFINSMNFKKIKELLGNNTHLETRKSRNNLEAINYCKKLDTQVEPFKEYGMARSQGERCDLADTARDVLNGKLLSELDPTMFVKFSKGLKDLKSMYDKTKSNEWRTLTNSVLIGPAGCGKTKFVYDTYGYENVYKLDPSDNNLWWDGYENQDILLIDDFYGTIKWGFILNILDGYPLRLNTKGSFTYAKWTKVYITSNKDYTKWYNKADISALKRRLNKIIYLPLADVKAEVYGNTIIDFTM